MTTTTSAGGRHLILKRTLDAIHEAAAAGPVSVAFCEEATELISELASGRPAALRPALEHVGAGRDPIVCHVHEVGDAAIARLYRMA